MKSFLWYLLVSNNPLKVHYIPSGQLSTLKYSYVFQRFFNDCRNIDVDSTSKFQQLSNFQRFFDDHQNILTFFNAFWKCPLGIWAWASFLMDTGAQQVFIIIIIIIMVALSTKFQMMMWVDSKYFKHPLYSTCKHFHHEPS